MSHCRTPKTEDGRTLECLAGGKFGSRKIRVVRAVGKVLGFEREGAIPLEAAPDPRNRTVQEISGIDLHGWFRGQALERNFGPLQPFTCSGNLIYEYLESHR